MDAHDEAVADVERDHADHGAVDAAQESGLAACADDLDLRVRWRLGCHSDQVPGDAVGTVEEVAGSADDSTTVGPQHNVLGKHFGESIDITGDAAVVKLVLDYPSAYITDYMTLLKIDGRWWIVNKAFTVESREAS